jgi:hypothetical protein
MPTVVSNHSNCDFFQQIVQLVCSTSSTHSACYSYFDIHAFHDLHRHPPYTSLSNPVSGLTRSVSQRAFKSASVRLCTFLCVH